MKQWVFFYVLFYVLVLGAFAPRALAQDYSRAPTFRAKLGMSLVDFKLGTQYENEKLNSLMIFQPTVLWDLPSFRSRLGLHFIGEYGGSFGATPISGMGLSGYFYPNGISSVYEFTPDGTLLQKTLSGPFVYATFTPVNFNLNKQRLGSGSGQPDLSVFSVMHEVGVGTGYDYAFKANTILAFELGYRYASAQESTAEGSIFYKGFCFFLVFSTSYY
jgi:hypothetical protein